MELASYSAYGICFVITLVLLIGVGYRKGSGFVTNFVFYLLAVVSFLSRDQFALTNDGGGKKSVFFFILIPVTLILFLMGLSSVLFGIYLVLGHALLKILKT
jgi:hypothetical protein